MKQNVNFPIAFDGSNTEMIEEMPNECPFCHKSITPKIIGANVRFSDQLRIVFLCPTDSCREVFIGYYEESGYTPSLYNVTTGFVKTVNFHESILNLSPNFVKIYNESFESEQLKLKEICGVGYRKALEFLIKDFAIKNNSENEDQIKKDTLQNVIAKFIDSHKIKTVAERAVWLGNDETHYVRKWDNKDLNDLKILIDLTLTMIQGDYDFNKLMEDMPNGKK